MKKAIWTLEEIKNVTNELLAYDNSLGLYININGKFSLAHQPNALCTAHGFTNALDDMGFVEKDEFGKNIFNGNDDDLFQVFYGLKEQVECELGIEVEIK